MTRRIGWVVAVWLGLSSTALAHKPAAFGDAGYSSAEDAYEIEDAATSIVIYREVTCERPELWLHLRAEKDFALFVQLLVPRIERLSNYRPAIAVVGKGLPMVDAGIALPAGMGAVVFRGDEVAEPKVFSEPFTGTEDWVLVEETVTVPETGDYYVVAWDPAHATGKLDVAIGTVEQFGADDFANAEEWTKKTRTFHETSDYPPAAPIEDTVCSADDSDAGTAELADGGQVLTTDGSCSVSDLGATKNTSGAWALTLAALALVLRRRQQSARAAGSSR